ncbi:hypothetical protein LTR28_008848, partial [Elasticomyces elasticus]
MGKAYNVLLATFAATGSFLFGYDSGVMTDVIASPNFLAYFDTQVTSPIIGAINSTFSGGAVLGSLMGGFTMDRFGRKSTIQIGALIAIVGAVLQSAAVNLSMMLVGRIISGWAVGLMSMSVPVYQAECANPLVLLAGLIWLPESPRYLVETHRNEEAMAVLRKLHYNGSNDDWIDVEFAEISATIQAEKEIVGSTDLRPDDHELTDPDVIGYYQTIMYNALGITGGRAVLVADLIFIIFLLDRVGRRKPLLFGAVGITIALVCEAAINSQNPAGTRQALSIAGVFFIFSVSVIFSVSFGPVSWVYMSEIMPMQIRGRGNAFATGVGNWL